MGDGRALQCGTSHFLGQNFAKAFNIRYLDDQNQLQFVWQTSWGVSTRLLGAIVMAMATTRDCGCRPRSRQPSGVVPILRKPEEGEQVLTAGAMPNR